MDDVIHYVSASCTLVLSSAAHNYTCCMTWACSSTPVCINVNQLVACKSNLFFFSIFFRWKRTTSTYCERSMLSFLATAQVKLFTAVEFWSGLEHPSDAKSRSISQMSFTVSHTWCTTYCLRQVCRHTALKHTYDLVTPVEPSAMLSTRRANAQPCYVRFSSILLLLFPGYFTVVAPARKLSRIVNVYFCRNPQLASHKVREM